MPFPCCQTTEQKRAWVTSDVIRRYVPADPHFVSGVFFSKKGRITNANIPKEPQFITNSLYHCMMYMLHDYVHDKTSFCIYYNRFRNLNPDTMT